MDLKKIEIWCVKWAYLTQDSEKWRIVVDTIFLF